MELLVLQFAGSLITCVSKMADLKGVRKYKLIIVPKRKFAFSSRSYVRFSFRDVG